MKGKKVLLGPSTFAALDHTPLERLIETGCAVIENPYKRKLTKSELLVLLSDDVTGLIAGLEPIDREVLEKTKLKVISRCGSGLSNIDLKAAKELGIKVFSTPHGPTSAVAELTLGALLSLLRMIPLMNRDLHEGKWNKKIGTQLEGKTIVIVGFGRIGRRLAELLDPFSTRILVVDPFLEDFEDDFPLLTMEEALPQADIVTLHVSGEDRIIGEREFQIIKPGAFVLNAARGGLIDEDSLIKSLEEGKIQGAWIDTFSQEPYSGPLTKYEQVILTPHIGSYSIECRRSMEMESVENLLSTLINNQE
ncbi:MAG: hydroxyacid dehydrogenase [Bacteroidia bacterium]|nr:hydroxyacid dehydrogenase [Bacteroidia bacterium]